MTRIEAWFDGLDPDARRGVGAVLLAVGAHAFLFALLSWWYVEDAAISFAFARNIVLGEGPAAFAGGEYVEGYSNPTWTLALAFLAFFRISPFIGAKLLGLLSGSASLAFAWRIARRLLPSGAATAVPLLLAVNPQFVIWNTSGLENGFFTLFLVWGLDRVLTEVEPDAPRTPWSALPLGLLAITRPEAPMYTAAIAVIAFFASVARRGPKDALVWAILWNACFLPVFAAWHWARFEVFGWPFPNTYYAKLATSDKFVPFDWNRKGWDYLRKFAAASSQGWLFPLYLASLSGLARWRRAALVFGTIVVGALLLSGFQPMREVYAEPVPLVQARIWTLFLVGLLWPLLSLGRDRAHVRILLWYVSFLSLFFTLYSGGDWMRGYRWMAMPVVPMLILLVDGAVTLADAIAPSPRWFARLLVAVPTLTGLVYFFQYLGSTETMPYDVRRRVLHMQQAAERLGLDDQRLTWMDVDMGAHLWWCDCDVVDMAGLVDVPMAHHKWQIPFVNQYVYQERKPVFAHVHGNWANRTRMTSHKQWKEFLEIDPFPVSPWTNHVGSHIRKDLFVDRGSLGGDTSLVFAGGIRGRKPVFASEVSPGGTLHVEVAFQDLGKTPFRTVVFLHGARDVTSEAPPGYDWYPATGWGREEIVRGIHEISLPADLPPGTYDLGLVLLQEGGGPLAAAATLDGTSDSPVYMAGEVRWPGAVTVVADGAARLEAAEDAAIASASGGVADCGVETWTTARRVLGRHDPRRDEAETRVRAAFAGCFAAQAERATDDDAATDAIVAARRFGHADAEVRRVGAALAEKWADQAEVAATATRRYDFYRRALLADPSRSDLRVLAENARDKALKIVSDDAPPPVDMGGD